jgi:hypothetical protein
MGKGWKASKTSAGIVGALTDGWIWIAVSGSTSPKHLGLKLLALCAPPLVQSVISRGAPSQAK